jgi:hypothetical protein
MNAVIQIGLVVQGRGRANRRNRMDMAGRSALFCDGLQSRFSAGMKTGKAKALQEG